MPDIQNEKNTSKTYNIKLPRFILLVLIMIILQSISFGYRHGSFYFSVGFSILLCGIIYMQLKNKEFVLTDNEIIIKGLFREHRIELSNIELTLAKGGGSYLNKSDNIFIGVLLQIMPEEMLLEVFKRIPLKIKVAGGLFGHYPPERMAAIAHDKLNSSTTWEALMARQILIFLSGQNPEFFLPGENPEKVLHWKKWLRSEYAESFNVMVYQKERKAIYRFSSILLLMTSVVFSVFLLCGWPLWIAGLILFMPVMLTVVVILFPLIKFKSLARRFNAN